MFILKLEYAHAAEERKRQVHGAFANQLGGMDAAVWVVERVEEPRVRFQVLFFPWLTADW